MLRPWNSKRTFIVIPYFEMSQKEEELEVTNCDFKLEKQL